MIEMPDYYELVETPVGTEYRNYVVAEAPTHLVRVRYHDAGNGNTRYGAVFMTDDPDGLLVEMHHRPAPACAFQAQRNGSTPMQYHQRIPIYMCHSSTP